MKVPARRRGNLEVENGPYEPMCLNESPRPKAGKSGPVEEAAAVDVASMKVPARRRGNHDSTVLVSGRCRLNESPRPKAGKSLIVGAFQANLRFASMKVPARRRGNAAKVAPMTCTRPASMKVPARRRGNVTVQESDTRKFGASMKVPARRRGNQKFVLEFEHSVKGLNESPRPKAGKSTFPADQKSSLCKPQ